MYLEFSDNNGKKYIRICETNRVFDPVKNKYVTRALLCAALVGCLLQTAAEEIGNAVTHGIGAALSSAAIPLLVVNAARLLSAHGAVAVVSMAICGGAMLFLYLMSTLYHSLTPAGAKKVFGILDHCAIYVLIAGTYTPYCLAALGGALGWTLFGLEWGIAVFGCTFYAIFGSRLRWLSALSSTATCCPKVGLPRRMSTAMSSTVPSTTRTSLLWLKLPFWKCRPRTTPYEEQLSLSWTKRTGRTRASKSRCDHDSMK